MTNAALVNETGISKSTMHNLLAALVAEGYLSRDDRTREYRLGPMLITLGAMAARQTDLLARASEALEPLAPANGRTYAIAQAIGGDRAQIIELFYPPNDMHVGIAIGTEFGPLDGALGKCLLAARPDSEIEEMVEEAELPQHTERSITDPAALLAELQKVRAQGWAASRQELNQNNAVAAPVPGADGRPEAFLLALGFPDQLTDEDIPVIGASLHEIAERISSESYSRPIPGPVDQTSAASGNHQSTAGEASTPSLAQKE